MDLKDIQTLSELSGETGKKVRTLQRWLDKAIEEGRLKEYKDYRKFEGKTQPTILSKEGAEKLISGKTIEYLLQYIADYIQETKNNDFWEFNLSGKEFEYIVMNNFAIDDELFFKMLRERIFKIIGSNINIYWEENMIERGKTLTIKRIKGE